MIKFLLKISAKIDYNGHHNLSDKIERLAQQYWMEKTLVKTGDDSSHEGHVIKKILDKHNIDEYFDYINASVKELRDMGLNNDEINILRGDIDGRAYAVLEWGWIRIVRNNAEVRSFDNSTISRLLRGWNDMYGERAKSMTFNIHRIQNIDRVKDVSFNRVPYDVLKRISKGGPTSELLGFQ